MNASSEQLPEIQSLGRSKAWSRAALIALAVTALIFLAMWITLGAPSSEGLGYSIGRIMGLNLFPYLITAGIASFRPRLRRWGPLVGLYLAVFVVLFVISGLGNITS